MPHVLPRVRNGAKTMDLATVVLALLPLAAPETATAVTAKVDCSPAWSPDDARIAFVRATVEADADGGERSPSQVLCVINADGSGETVVTGAPSRLSWSPRRESNVIIFALWRTVFVLDADTLVRRRLARCESPEPAFDSFFDVVELSLDGKRAFIVQRGPRKGTRYVAIVDVETGQPLGGAPTAVEAWGDCGRPPRFPLRSSRGYSLVRLGNHIELVSPGSRQGVPLFLVAGMYPAKLRWSSDGSNLSVAFPTGEVWAAQTNNGALWQVTPAREPSPAAEEEGEQAEAERAPAFGSLSTAISPHGEAKAFFYGEALWVYERSTGERRRVAHLGPRQCGYAAVAWSHDGKRLAYSWNGRIGVADLAGEAHFITGPPWKSP
ncbi:MAG: hypothetical protein ACE5O2_04490 [Armatimonadota bacterium]